MRMSKDLISLASRRVLITGAASGIGKAIALRFADAGADLILLDSDAAGLAQVSSEVRELTGEILTQVVDVGEKAQVDAFWRRLGSGPGVPDTLINNAGCYPIRDYLEIDEAFLERTLRVNLLSTFWMTQAFIAARGHLGGIIVNVASLEALIPLRDDLIPYSVSKAGALALTRSLAHAYGRRGFRANTLVPGAIHSPNTQRQRDTALRHVDSDHTMSDYHYESRVGLGRWGEADEVARAALFLASDLASYVHGCILPVDGGFLAS